LSFGKKILGLVSLLVMLSLWGGFFYVYQSSRDGHLGGMFDSYGSCGVPPASGESFYRKDHLALTVKNTTLGEFTVSGSVNVSERTFNRYELGKNELRLRLEPLQASLYGVPLFYEEIKVKPLSRNFASPNKNAYAALEARPIPVVGQATNFPFDVYRYGYRPVLYILKGNEQIDLKFRHITTSLDLSNTFTPMQKFHPLDYINEKNSLVDESEFKPYSSNECAFSIERKGSFKVLVVVLLLVICLPLLYVFYRNEPAIDFLATLLGVAAVRVFLVGPLHDFQLYSIDFAFAGAIILAGTVSLIKVMRRDAQRAEAARSGFTW